LPRRKHPTADAVASAIAASNAMYENLLEDYENGNCPEIWGELPPKTTSSTARDNLIATKSDEELKGGVVCTCGMTYDMIVSQDFLDEEDFDVVTEEEASNVFSSSSKASSSNSETMTKKMDSWIKASTSNSFTPCVGGNAAGFDCKDVDLVAHMPLSDFLIPNTNQKPGQGNDVWGWTSKNNREFVIWGVREGHYFIEVTDFNPVILGYLPSAGDASNWHDVKIVGDFAYMGSEADDHGMQVFYLSRLLDIDPKKDCEDDRYCQIFDEDVWYRGTSDFPVRKSHNIVANEESGYVYIVSGDNECDGGLHVVDVANPLNPKFKACFGEGGYVHDAQCVNYNGPDTKYQDSEICFSFNANKVHIVDVTNKSRIKIISTIEYDDVGYTHQGWLSSDHSHLIFADELDEAKGFVARTRTLVANVEDLENPTNIQAFLGPTPAIDHNQYVVKATAEGQDYDPTKFKNTDLIYQSNYRAGLAIVQVLDYETADMKEIAYFDTFPLDNSPFFAGTWSNFPYFRSGLVAISNIGEGLFLVKPNLEDALIVPPIITNDKPPTSSPTTYCSDGVLEYKDDEKKDCVWVGEDEKKVKKRCNKKWGGVPNKGICRETCGNVGLGECKDKKKKKKKKKNRI